MCSLEDAFPGRIVGYSIGERMTSDLAVSALANASILRKPTGTICHSDRAISIWGLCSRADRDKRAAILTAEGEKQSQILSAEGARQADILRAEGEAQAVVIRAEGEATAIARAFKESGS